MAQLTLTSAQETTRPSDDTEQKLCLSSMSFFCQQTWIRKRQNKSTEKISHLTWHSLSGYCNSLCCRIHFQLAELGNWGLKINFQTENIARVEWLHLNTHPELTPHLPRLVLSPARLGLCACQSLLCSCTQAPIPPSSGCRQPHSHHRSPPPLGRNAARGCPGTLPQNLWGRCALERQNSSTSRIRAFHALGNWSRLASRRRQRRRDGEMARSIIKCASLKFYHLKKLIVTIEIVSDMLT